MIPFKSTSLYTNSQACSELNLLPTYLFRKTLNNEGEFLSKDGFFGGQFAGLRGGFVHHFSGEPIMHRAKPRSE